MLSRDRDMLHYVCTLYQPNTSICPVSGFLNLKWLHTLCSFSLLFLRSTKSVNSVLFIMQGDRDSCLEEFWSLSTPFKTLYHLRQHISRLAATPASLCTNPAAHGVSSMPAYTFTNFCMLFSCNKVYFLLYVKKKSHSTIFLFLK